MRKVKYASVMMILCLGLAACSSTAPSEALQNNSPQGNTPQENQPSVPNGADQKNDAGAPNESRPTNGVGKGNGFSFQEIEQALKEINAIQGAGESYPTTGTNMEEARKYGNMVIGLYQNHLEEGIQALEKGHIKINGTTAKVQEMVGGFVIMSLDGSTLNEEMMRAILAVAGL